MGETVVAAQDYRQTIDDRVEPRDEVYHRTRASLADQRRVPMVIVNLSPQGLMARIEVDLGVGEWIKVALPVVGTVDAAVRWSLGGRIGCQLERPISPGDYRALLNAAGG